MFSKIFIWFDLIWFDFKGFTDLYFSNFHFIPFILKSSISAFQRKNDTSISNINIFKLFENKFNSIQNKITIKLYFREPQIIVKWYLFQN